MSETTTKPCRICGENIAAKRLQAMPDTLVCITCSEQIGGEYELEVNIGTTGKPGSLKRTGQSVAVRRTHKPLR